MNMMHTNTAHTNLTCTNMTHTNITHTTTLSRKEQEDIRRITAQCRLTDGLSPVSYTHLPIWEQNGRLRRHVWSDSPDWQW